MRGVLVVGCPEPIGGTCLAPKVMTLVVTVNSSYNGWRFEVVWLET